MKRVLLSSKSCLFYLPEARWRLETTNVANFVGKKERVREGGREGGREEASCARSCQ